MKILFVHNALTTFVKIDRDLLEKHFEIDELYLQHKKDIRPRLIWEKVKRNDIVFGWFSSWHTFLPIHFASLLKKPSILVTGGYDTANVPVARYGNQRHFFSRSVTNQIIRTATHLICNSNFTRDEVLKVVNLPKDRISVIYHGLPDKGYAPAAKQNIALNVGNVSNANLLRKGIEPFLETAAHLSTYRFVQVGKHQDSSASSLKQKLASNAEIKGYISRKDLDILYRKSKVYIQPSLHEGFGMSVVEAMLAGCIPIVSRHGALPEVVKEYGILLNDIKPTAIKQSVLEAENDFPFNPKQIRDYALNNYSLEKREIGLLMVIEKVLNRQKSKGLVS